jgi:LemA protein
MKKGSLVALAIVAVLLVWGVVSYNKLVRLGQGVEAQWAQVQNVYQRRLDLIPNLVETVKGAANFEKETYTAVAEARSRAGQVTVDKKVLEDPAAFQKFQQAQDQLSGALSRLLVVAEQYPDLKATQAFRDLQAQLEGTENRIAVERMRFNEVARDFNSKRASFPTVLIAGILGFHDRPYFQATAGAETPPKVKF